jgi:Fe-S-cluster containining protein
MKEITLSSELTKEIAAIYQAMQEGYDRVSNEVGLTCEGCSDNCCDSYFRHHTYSEWAYLWQGLHQLNPEELERIVSRAKEYIAQSAKPLAEGKHPEIMCPLHDNGLCSLYHHRMLVCRMHGIPATLTRPDGQSMRFPGCFRCQEIVKEKYEPETDAPAMDRSQLFRRLAALEASLLEERSHLYPRVKKTLAEMIIAGPPAVPLPHCER